MITVQGVSRCLQSLMVIVILMIVFPDAGQGQDVNTTRLAGNALNQYPYFEYVKAFNEDAGVQLALDPDLFPEISGRTADIYVVEARDEAGWDADATLIDVTAGGFLSFTFSAASIQANTIAVAEPNDLSSARYVPATNANTGLGHGYDLVVDMNRDGVLNGGDFIDGYSDEAGLYIIHDTTAGGPLAVTQTETYSVGAVFGIPNNNTREILYYPTDIADMQPLPLIFISHGSGHNYTWYNHIGHHMASYGYIVVSHQNEPPAATLLGHIDAFLDQQSSIASGVLEGKIDQHRMTWIGHSWGAVNTVIQYNRLVTGDYLPVHYSADDVVLISSMLPPAGPREDGALPGNVNFHLWTASGDSQIGGNAGCNICQTYQLHDRARGFRMSTTVQGTGHAWFHDGTEQWGDWFEGPCSIGKEGTHLVQLGLLLPLIKHFSEGNIPATDFFWRQYESFHPIGVDLANPCFVVSNECRVDSTAGLFYIDDFQTEYALTSSSSGGGVTYTVNNITEGIMEDNNSTFYWDSSDPFNGATRSGEGDNSRGIVFDWTDENLFLQWEVVAEAQNFKSFRYISFRAEQGTQHPNTLFETGDETFSLTLIDGAGTSSSINIGAYGGGLEQPYLRFGGWHNEMERVRIPVNDFLAGGSGLDLSNITAVRMDVGPDFGSTRGRIIVDELMLSDSIDPAGVSAVASVPSSKVHLKSFPNPFNPRTMVEVELAAASAPVPVILTVIDIKGHRLASIFAGSLAGGASYQFVWNGTDDEGRSLPSGTYLAHIRAGSVTANHKLVLLR